MQMLAAPIGSASDWGLCYNNIIMPRDHFAKSMRSPRFQTDAYQESAEAKYEKKAEDMIKSFTKKIKHIFTIKKGNK
jgi:hypothetical protein